MKIFSREIFSLPNLLFVEPETTGMSTLLTSTDKFEKN